MSNASLIDQRVLVIGSGGIAAAIADDLRADADVVVAARTARDGADIVLDLADEASIAAAFAQVGGVDHIVSTASAMASGPVAELDTAKLDAAIAAKLRGPLLLAKHAGGVLSATGTLTFFSGVVAWRPGPGQAVTAATNGGLAHLGAALAVELAPRRVNVVSPGIVDSGLWDGMGEAEREAFFARTAERLPARRVGQPADVAAAVRFLLTNPFATGSVLHLDGGGRWA